MNEDINSLQNWGCFINEIIFKLDWKDREERENYCHKIGCGYESMAAMRINGVSLEFGEST